MNKQNDAHGEEVKPPKRTYTMDDLLEATKEILKSDAIGKKLPDSAIASLSKLLAKTAIKGDL
jgi:hypothetical protein